MAFGIKSAGLSISVCLAAAVVASTVTRDVQADVRCFPVSGKIHSLFTSTNCTSPVGLCTVGTIVGGDLDGATSFQALDAAPSAGLPAVEAAANLSY